MLSPLISADERRSKTSREFREWTRIRIRGPVFRVDSRL